MEPLRVVSPPAQPGSAPLDEWDRLTRFLESARVAFARERELWESLGIHDPESVQISARADEHGQYSVALTKHIDAVEDAQTLHGSVLVHSYALAEATAIGRLGIDSRSHQGIEDWGARLLQSTGSDWSMVKGGLAGAVEVAVVRNAFAHGSRTFDEAAAARLLAAGASTRRVGAPVKLGYPQLRGFRARLLSLLTVGGVGR